MLERNFSTLDSKVKIYNFSRYLIENNKFCFAQLDEEEKEIMSGYILDRVPKIHAFEYISDADHKTELPYMLSNYMKKRDSSLGQEILDLLCKNASNMMSNKIDEILEYARKNYELDQAMESNDE